MSKAIRTVVVLQRVLPHYRVAFFSRLADALSDHGVALRVLYGQERPGAVPKSVYPDAPWAEFVENSYWEVGGTELVWQKCLGKMGSPDLVIIEQANRLLVNYPLLALRALTGRRVAYWGHGRNLQSGNATDLRERLKRRMIRSVDWWFAYTQMSADLLREAAYPPERVTVVENSIDTGEFARAMAAVSGQQIERLRATLGIGIRRVALYCGGMYPDKRLPFLLEALVKLHESLPDFTAVLIGSGPDAKLVEDAAARYPWIHYVGAVYGSERAAYFAMSDVMLMPGLVGLAIVDSFVAGLPMVTTDIPIHSPEIAYLQSGKNGLMARHDVSDYVAAVRACLTDDGLASALRRGCQESARHYTLDNMVRNFARGTLAALKG